MMARATYCMLAAMALGAAGADEQVELMERLVAAQQGVTTVQGEFQQSTSRSDEVDQAPSSVFVVQFAIKAPDRYCFTYTKPGDAEWRMRICSDGKTAWTIEQFMAGEKPHASSKPVDPAGNDPFRRIADFFPLDEAGLTRDFAVRITAIQNAFLVDLRPATPELAEQAAKVSLILDPEFRLQDLTLEEPSGARVVIGVKQAEYNKPIADEVFTYQQPKP
jgi:outer membrane lipoprotein-sorting protein